MGAELGAWKRWAMTNGQATGRGNFFSRFWDGSYSLPFSYWVVSFLGNLIATGLIGVWVAIFEGAEVYPYTLAAYVVVLWTLVVGWTVFQLVGVWRSATQYREGKRKQNKSSVWGVLAQITLILGGFNLAATCLNVVVPQLREVLQVAFENDPSIPDYTIRVMRNGTEIEIAGGFKYGLANDMEKIMLASPQIKVVHLNSLGGRLQEAKKVARIVRTKGLVTYTSSECASACSIAFAAGRDRWIRTGAKLGFHRASFAGEELGSVMLRDMLEAGYDRSFADRAIAYSADKMWYPSVSELEAAKVISGVVDNYKFAASGYGIRPGTEDFAKELRNQPLFGAIAKSEPLAFANMTNKFQKNYVDGVPEGAIQDEIRANTMIPLILSRLPRADNQIQVDYAKLIADQYDAVGSVDAKACYDYAVNGSNVGSVIKLFGTELKQREFRLFELLLASSVAGRTSSSQEHVEAIFK